MCEKFTTKAAWAKLTELPTPKEPPDPLGRVHGSVMVKHNVQWWKGMENDMEGHGEPSEPFQEEAD
jgi:hypothetical protein